LKITKPDAQWREELSPEAYAVLRQAGTERPFTGELLNNKEEGIYVCAGCGQELFASEAKFDAHCGWPSFDKAKNGDAIKERVDYSHGMKRVETVCARCGGHLGHVFEDGPTSTGLRYCMNSVALKFEKE
jgi:methionine-R-sulfoxide reductase